METMISVEFKFKGSRYLSIDLIPEICTIVVPESVNLYKEKLEAFKNDPISNKIGIVGTSTLYLDKHEINRTKFYDFVDLYAKHLYDAFQNNPLDYGQGYDITLNNMKYAILKGTFNKDSESFKKTCKELKIKHTYKAIDEFLERKAK